MPPSFFQVKTNLILEDATVFPAVAAGIIILPELAPAPAVKFLKVPNNVADPVPDHVTVLFKLLGEFATGVNVCGHKYTYISSNDDSPGPTLYRNDKFINVCVAGKVMSLYMCEDPIASVPSPFPLAPYFHVVPALLEI